jgi:hypothetical protein
MLFDDSEKPTKKTGPSLLNLEHVLPFIGGSVKQFVTNRGRETTTRVYRATLHAVTEPGNDHLEFTLTGKEVLGDGLWMSIEPMVETILVPLRAQVHIDTVRGELYIFHVSNDGVSIILQRPIPIVD